MAPLVYSHAPFQNCASCLRAPSNPHSTTCEPCSLFLTHAALPCTFLIQVTSLAHTHSSVPPPWPAQLFLFFYCHWRKLTGSPNSVWVEGGGKGKKRRGKEGRGGDRRGGDSRGEEVSNVPCQLPTRKLNGEIWREVRSHFISTDFLPTCGHSVSLFRL